MRDAIVVEAVRSPPGKRNGGLASVIAGHYDVGPCGGLQTIREGGGPASATVFELL